ncbi:MAG TPA: SDR family NAD(P)-dependent oxidoreductase [Bacteroidales bacterium]|nr:SDR family NAD(P)-dependent oxidoreductase [Bacteroidales bacterium]
MDYYSLVTGASSGIGKAIATELAGRKHNLLLISLPEQGLEKFSNFLQITYGIKTDWLETDLSISGTPKKVYEWAQNKKYMVNTLVNNAGVAGTMGIDMADAKYIDDRLLVNVRALVVLCHYFIPDMKKLPEAYILNIASLSAFYAIPFKSIYAASKAFVVSFSRAISTELKYSGISVSVVCPNGVRTNEGTHTRIEAHGNIVRLTTVTPEQVAKSSVNGMLKRKFMIIPGHFNLFLLFISRFMPSGLKQYLLYREFHKEILLSGLTLEPGRRRA